MLIGHAVKVTFASMKDTPQKGRVSSFQAMTAAVSGTVGLGNIAGVAIAISLGGPGALVWMIVAAFLGTATKFAEVTLGHLYRRIDDDGTVHGGPFYYITEGFKEKGFTKFGKFLAVVFSICAIGGAIGGGNMLQSNESINILTSSFPSLVGSEWIIAALLAVTVFAILIGSIKRIASVTEKLVPLMAIIYVLACAVVLFNNAAEIPAAISTIFTAAFNFEAAGGGAVGAMIMGFRRAFFSNEAGVGSAPIAHAATSNDDPVKEGIVALIEPIIDTVIICSMTGLVIVTTGVYTDAANGTGVVLTAAAFATVIDWFPQVLAICVVLFAYSTMLTWSYYGEQAWHYMFGKKTLPLYYTFFCSMTFLGGMVNLGPVVDFGDLMLLSMAIPNLIAVFVLRHTIRDHMQAYVKKMKNTQICYYERSSANQP